MFLFTWCLFWTHVLHRFLFRCHARHMVRQVSRVIFNILSAWRGFLFVLITRNDKAVQLITRPE